MQRLLSKERIREMYDSFPEFLTEVWLHIGLPVPSPVQLDIADYLQNGPSVRQIQALRGAAKSWMTCAYVCWTLWRNPETEVLIVSASGSTANNFSYLIKRWIQTIPFLSHMMPGDGHRDTQNEFDVGTRKQAGASASVRSKGITGMITGGRAHLIIGDDIETPDNSGTVVQRLNIRKKVTEFEAILHPGGQIIYLGTPHHEDSVYGQLEADGYELRRWPAEFPSLDDEVASYNISEWLRKQVEEDPSLVGHSIYPERFSDEDLQNRRLRMGESAYKLQYLLNRSLSNEERYPLKVKDLISFNFGNLKAPVSFDYAASQDTARKDLDSVGFIGDMWYRPMRSEDLVLPYDDIIMGIDPSGSGADETAYVVGGVLAGNLYLLASGGLKGGYHSDALNSICKVAHELRVRRIMLERNLGAGTFTELFKNTLYQYYKDNPFYIDKSPALPPLVEDTWATGQKEVRIINILEPLFNQHRVIVNDLVAKDNELWYQVTHLSRDRGCLKHDDRVDALSLLAATVQTQLHIDLDLLKKKKEEERLEALGREFDLNIRIPFDPPSKKKDKKSKRWF